MDASTVRQLVARFQEAGIPVWLDGGWGVDALLGRQTRAHRDLDLLVRVTDVVRLLRVCESAGFAACEGGPPHAFVLRDSQGRGLDIHAVTFRPDGTAVHLMDDGNEWVFQQGAFSGTGTVDGTPVLCLSPEAQVLCHAQGYQPAEKDKADMQALEQAFNVKLPLSLRRTQA
ncbi:MAG: nucleotidyltransferase domain-containing protein [Vicinamibacterales bacterium]